MNALLQVIYVPFSITDDRVFLLFHRNLSDALTQLAQAIYAVLSRKFTTIWWKNCVFFLLLFFLIDHPVEPGKTPTEAHTGLKNLIDALVEEIKDDTSFHVREKMQFSDHNFNVRGQKRTKKGCYSFGVNPLLKFCRGVKMIYGLKKGRKKSYFRNHYSNAFHQKLFIAKKAIAVCVWHPYEKTLFEAKSIKKGCW